jgi:dipeptidyl aminopeptidase/acylaminoacyl peptidase
MLMRVFDGVDPRRMAKVQFHRFKARDGREIPVWLTIPANASKDVPLPAVVMVHGGPWVRGGEWRWDPMNQFLASRGYLVIEPEFRGSTGFGDDHFRASWKQWGQAMQDDVNDALKWAREKGAASPHACIAGASYGGYSTLIGLTRDSDLWRCGVAWVAVADLMMLVRGSWTISDDVGYSRRYGIPRLVADPKTDENMIRANSPVEQADKIKAPLLLAMGEDDIRVPLAHGTRMRDAMTRAGKPLEWVLYANEGHGWRKPENRIDWARRVDRFLSQHLGNAAAPKQ